MELSRSVELGLQREAEEGREAQKGHKMLTTSSLTCRRRLVE